MLRQARIEIINPSNPVWNETVRLGLQAYNRDKVGSRDFRELSIYLRDESGEIVGGILGGDIWGWMLLETTWIHDDYRGQGYGKKMLTQAEAVARQRGCSWLIAETFSFQALPFYLKQGYVIYGQLDNFPRGESRYSLKKDLGKPKTAPLPEFPMLASIPRQPEYEDGLFQILLDLLNRRDLGDLLQRIVDYAAVFLDAPYGEIMLVEGDELVVRAFTRNQPYLLGDRVKRGEAKVSWLAFDARQPVLIEDYFTWTGKRIIYDEAQVHAVADFPIIHGEICLGVLAMGRVQENHPFSALDSQRGMQLAQLIAVVIDNIELHQNTLAQNQALEKARREAEEASRVKSQFLANMSHELRTPMNAIIGYTGILLEGMAGEIDEDARQMLMRVEENGKALLAMINDILDIAKIEAGRIEFAIEALDPKALALAWFEQTEVLAQQKDLKLTLELGPNLPEFIYGDNKRLSQIARNLLSNAIKFTLEGGIKIYVTATDEMWMFSVSDTGIGIDAERLEHIFDRFYQVDSTDKRAFGGTGLGLAISRLLCQQMGGDIQVKSRVGTGSTFTACLPRNNIPVIR